MSEYSSVVVCSSSAAHFLANVRHFSIEDLIKAAALRMGQQLRGDDGKVRLGKFH